MKKIIVTLVALFTLVACGAPVTGVVIEKDYDRGYSKKYETTERYSCGTERRVSGYGKQTKYNTQTKYCNRRVEKIQRVPDDWDVTVRDEKGQEHEVNVNQWDYNMYRIGDKYPKATR